jgi:hypothetical protein
MDTSIAGEEPPPDPLDLAGWQHAVADGRFRRFRLEAVVAAIQDLGPLTDKKVLHPLLKHLSDATNRMLRAWVGPNHPNDGWDIIERAHFQIFEALFQPHSADGKALREAFGSRVSFRMKDAIGKEARLRRVPTEQKSEETDDAAALDDADDVDGTELVDVAEHPDQAEDVEPSDGDEAAPKKAARDPSLLDGVRDLDETIDVERVLMTISDDRKRLAFRLHMEGIPFKSRRSASIEKALDISEKTARDWIEEVQELLKTKVGDQP